MLEGLPDNAPVVLTYAARFFLSFVFVLAGAVKIAHGEEFVRAVGNYRVLPQGLVRPVALWLPRVELAGGLALALGVATVPVALAIVALLFAFSGAIALNLVRGRKMSCNCFGAATAERLTWWSVARNVVLVAMAAAVALNPPVTLTVWPGPGVAPATPTLTPQTALAMLFLSTTAASLVVLLRHAWRASRAAASVERRLGAPGGSPG